MAGARAYRRMKRFTNTVAIVAVGLSLLIATACTSKTDRARINYNFESEQGSLALEDGDYPEAEKRFRLALEAAERGWGAEHENTAVCLSDLGLLHYRKGDHKQAEAFYKRALALRRKLGDPVKTANTLMFLAAAAEGQGETAQADAALAEALSLREKKLGGDHIDVARTLEFLASSYWKQGKYADAEPLLERALGIREQKSGKESKGLLNTMNNLAAVEFRLGKYVEAEALYKRMLAIQEKILGKEHPAVSFTLDSYAQILRETGRGKQAEQFEQRASKLRARALAQETKAKLNRFARSVTFHLLDDSYTTVESSQLALANTELAPELTAEMKKQNLIAATAEKLQDRVGKLASIKQTTDVRIDEAYPLEPNRRGLVPVRVKGMVTVKSTNLSASSKRFDIEYLIGFNKQTNEPMVAMVSGLPVPEESAKPADTSIKPSETSAKPPDTSIKPSETSVKPPEPSTKL